MSQAHVVRPAIASEQGPTTAFIWMCSLASAFLLYASFFPLNWSWLGWFALIPWLFLARVEGQAWKVYPAAACGAVLFCGGALQWARVADPRMVFTWIFLSFYCSGFLLLGLIILRRLQSLRRIPFFLLVPITWVSLEYLRWGLFGGFYSIVSGSHLHDFPGGFAWYFLGHTQHDFLEMVQIADLTGVYGVSFLVALVNAVLFEWIWTKFSAERFFRGASIPAALSKSALLRLGLFASLLLLVTLAYGRFRLGQKTESWGPRIALVQTNLDQRIRNDTMAGEDQGRSVARRKAADHFAELVDLASKHRPDLIVTPETSYPGYWEEFAQGKPTRNSRDLAQRLAARGHTPILLGMNTAVADEEGNIQPFNSAILLDREGDWAGRYDKIHRVPFGEYIPLRSMLPVLNRLAPYDFDYVVRPGSGFTPLEMSSSGKVYRFGVLICYEDTDPAMALPYARGPRPVDFLVNISNDGWFDGTEEHDQHLALCRFRAIETRRAVARSVNMGISAVVDGNGRILAPRQIANNDRASVWTVGEESGSLSVSGWVPFKQTPVVLIASVPLDARSSIYASIGDLFAWCCAGVLLVLLGLSWFSPRNNRP